MNCRRNFLIKNNYIKGLKIKTHLLIIAFLVLVISGAVLIAKYSFDISNLWFAISINNKKYGEVCFKNNCFRVELSSSSGEQRRGLMFRKNLDLNEGMLFVYPKEEEYSIWMKNTLIPLDIIWISGGKEIVFINENTLPCKIDPCLSIKSDKKAQYILEVNSGVVKSIGLTIGERVDIKK